MDYVRIGRSAGAALLWWGLFACTAYGAVVAREPIAEGVVAAIQRGRVLYLDCRPPQGDAAKDFLGRYLAEPEDWTDYRDRLRVGIPYNRLNPKTQRAVMQAIFPADYVDEAGWWHTVVFDDERGVESVWALAEWLTGLGTHHRAILADERNHRVTGDLQVGQKILVPADLLLPVMKVPSVRPEPAPEPEVSAETATPDGVDEEEPQANQTVEDSEPSDDENAEDSEAPEAARDDEDAEDNEDEEESPEPSVPLSASQLKYGADTKGPYAVYRLRPGEALFSSVVVRFTDIRENGDILRACDTIMARSGIKNDRDIEVGTRIVIPLDMLSDRFQPKGSDARESYEAVQREAERLQQQKVAKRDLEGVVVMLDAGHGGKDSGAKHVGSQLYEDEICYDIVCRIKKILERETGAQVILTVEDPSQGFRTTERSTFVHDTDERLLTTPFYDNSSNSVSLSLRWCLANATYERLLKEGVDERNMLFATIHCDWLYRGRMRGAMVYVPGARYSVVKYPLLTHAVYRNHAESKNRQTTTPPLATRQRNEALSRNFAKQLLQSIATHDPPLKVHRDSPNIRNVIHNGGQSYVPAVLRYNKFPTRVLVEAANLSNSTDRKRVADPNWRQWFAEAFVDAVKAYYSD